MRAIDADALITELNGIKFPGDPYVDAGIRIAVGKVCDAPTIEPQPEQKYTNKELRVFMHGISMRLLSLRSAQHWQYDDETAEEIKFLERLYKKVESEVTQ